MQLNDLRPAEGSKKARKRVLIEGVAANGRQQYLVFGSEE